MIKVAMDKEVFITSNGVFDFYILHTRNRWHAIIYPAGKTKDSEMAPREWTRASCATKQTALRAIEFWTKTMTEPLE